MSGLQGGILPVRVIDLEHGKPHRAPEIVFPGQRPAREARARGGRGVRRMRRPSRNGEDSG